MAKSSDSSSSVGGLLRSGTVCEKKCRKVGVVILVKSEGRKKKDYNTVFGARKKKQQGIKEVSWARVCVRVRMCLVS